MTIFAELDDLAVRFPRELTAAETERAETLLSDASFWVGAWIPGLVAAAVDPESDVAVAAKLVVVSMVRRAILAPALAEGASSVANMMGPWSQTVAYRNPDGNLYLSSVERDTLTRLVSGRSSGAVSMMSPGL